MIEALRNAEFEMGDNSREITISTNFIRADFPAGEKKGRPKVRLVDK